jgi:hypothetical protein
MLIRPLDKGPTRQRVATAATGPARALFAVKLGATIRQGVSEAAAASAKRRAGVKPTSLTWPTTAASAFDRNPSSIAHSAAAVRGGVTKIN